MADSRIQMDYQALAQASQKYKQAAADLKQVYQNLGKAGDLFRTAGFCGVVAGAIMKVITEVMKMLIQKQMNKFNEVASDLLQSIAAHVTADQTIVPKFKEGISLD